MVQRIPTVFAFTKTDTREGGRFTRQLLRFTNLSSAGVAEEEEDEGPGFFLGGGGGGMMRL